ncbi:acyl carrier protein [Streptomyces sp. NPDC085614]|uniref:acyl carrier protein n=1 Tax=Streptomyces sp. NPDC085614 TaxID=3365733 RepID=UPI0037D0BB3F
MDRQFFYSAVRSAIQEFSGEQHVGGDQFGEDENFFDLGLITSLSMVRLLVQVEKLLGTEVDVTLYEPESLFTLRGLYDTLVPAGSLE